LRLDIYKDNLQVMLLVVTNASQHKEYILRTMSDRL